MAFVDVARAIALPGNTRATTARIAALTGLTRLEVSRLSKANRTLLVEASDKQNRATRVAIGWLTDSAFTDARHRSRQLPITTSRAVFTDLVRKYSGDIPARAMLLEMVRLGMVKSDNKGLVSLVRVRPPLTRSTVAAIRAISPWVDGVSVFSDSEKSSRLASDFQQINLYFESRSEAYAAARELESRWNSFVSGAHQLGTTKKQVGAFEVILSLALATAEPRVRGSRNR